MASAVQNGCAFRSSISVTMHRRTTFPRRQGPLRGGAFLLTVDEDDAPVLGPTSFPWRFSCVGSWAVKNTRSMVPWSMTSASYSNSTTSAWPVLAADLLVGGVLNMASCIARPSRKHALQVLHRRFNAPEASPTNHEFTWYHLRLQVYGTCASHHRRRFRRESMTRSVRTTIPTRTVREGGGFLVRRPAAMGP